MKDMINYENRLNILAVSVLGLPLFGQSMAVTKPIIRKSPKRGRNEICDCGCGYKVKYCPFTRKDSL